MRLRLSYSRLLGAAALLGLLVLAASCASMQPSAARFAAESLLSEDTVALCRIPDVEEACSKWKKTAAGQAWQAPEMDYYLSRQVLPAIETGLRHCGIADAKKILRMISGEAVLAIELPPASGSKKDLRVYAMMDFGENGARGRKAVQGIPAMAGVKSTDIRVHHHWLGSTLVLSSSETGLAQLLQRQKWHARWLGMGGKPGNRQTLKQAKIWGKMRGTMLRDGDAYVFADLSRIIPAATQLAKAEMERRKLNLQWLGADLFLKTLGVQSLQALAISVQMRDKAFYTKTAIAYQDEATGILAPYQDPKPLETPLLAPSDLESFSAMRIHPPVQMWSMLKKTLENDYPGLDKMASSMIEGKMKQVGLDMDSLLRIWGSEMAFLSDASSTRSAGFAILREIADEEALRRSVQNIEKLGNGSSRARSVDGQSYTEHRFARIPIPIYTSRFGKFLMISMKDDWIRAFAAKRGERFAPADSLLHTLEEPFEALGVDSVATARAYSNPVPGLIQVNGMLPLAIPIINMQLKRMEKAQIPLWAIGTIPPLLPFAQNAFPTVGRVSQSGSNLIIKESYSSFDPTLSPLVAMGVAISGHYLENQKAK